MEDKEFEGKNLPKFPNISVNPKFCHFRGSYDNILGLLGERLLIFHKDFLEEYPPRDP